MENEMTTTQGSKLSLEFGCGFNRGFKDVGRGASRQAQGLRGDGTRAGSKGRLQKLPSFLLDLPASYPAHYPSYPRRP